MQHYKNKTVSHYLTLVVLEFSVAVEKAGQVDLR